MKEIRKKFDLRSQEGDALIGVMTAAVIGIILVLGMVSSILYMSKYTRSVQLDSDQADMADQIRLILSNSDICSSLLQNENLAPAIAGATATPAPYQPQNYRFDANNTVKINGQDFELDDPNGTSVNLPQSGLALDLLRVQVLAAPAPISYPAPTVGVNFGAATQVVPAKLYIGVSKTGDTYGSKPKLIDIPITILSFNNRLRYCATDPDEGTICRAMGKTWFPFPLPGSNGKRCLDSAVTCTKGGSYANAPAFKGGFINALTGGYSCPANYTPRRSGTVTYASSCGKNCVNNEYTDVIQCLACTLPNGIPLSVWPADATSLAGTSGLNLDPTEADAENAFMGDATGIDQVAAAIPGVVTPTPYPVATPAGNCASAQSAYPKQCNGTVSCQEYYPTMYTPYMVIVSEVCSNGSAYNSINGSTPYMYATPAPTVAPTAAPTTTPTPGPTPADCPQALAMYSNNCATTMNVTCAIASNGDRRVTEFCDDGGKYRSINGGPVTYIANPACFVAGTKVNMGDGSVKAIESIEAGDKVLAYNEATNSNYVTVVKAPIHHQPQRQTLHHFTLEDGRQFTSNAEHPFFIYGEPDWRSAVEVYSMFLSRESVYMRDRTGRPVRIVDIRIEEKNVPVYNLDVHGMSEKAPGHNWSLGVGHTYYVDGILVHNAAAAKQPTP